MERPTCRLHSHLLVLPELPTFWLNIFDAFTEIFGRNYFSQAFVCTMFGAMPQPYLITGKAQRVIALTTLIARKIILLCWKKQSPPSFTRWIGDSMHFLKLEKIKHTLRGTTQRFTETWIPFIQYHEDLHMPFNERMTRRMVRTWGHLPNLIRTH